MNVTPNSDNIVNALIEHELEIRGGFQQETNHVPLEVMMNGNDASYSITLNDTEA